MKPVEWIDVKDRLPEDDREVVVMLDYQVNSKNGKIDMRNIAIMYRKDGSWYFRNGESEYKGKYITYWLDIDEM